MVKSGQGSTPMDTLRIQVFKDSFRPIVNLLNEHQVPYEMRMARMGVPMNSGETIEIVKAVGNVAVWGALASVVVAFIRAKAGRKVIITTEDKTVVHAEGYSVEQLAEVLKLAATVTAIDTGKRSDDLT
jgi:hypothetical protein